MSQPAFLVDHDFNEHIVEGLLRREPSIDLIRCRDVGLAQHADTQILEYAASVQRLVLSHDVNTMSAAAKRRVASGSAMCGLLLAPQLSPVRTIIDDLLLIWVASETDEWKDHICFSTALASRPVILVDESATPQRTI